MHPLDNPIWHALTTVHSRFAKIYNSAGKFPCDVSMLAGLSEPTPENYDSLAALLNPDEHVGLFLAEPANPPASWTIVSSVPLLQMLCQNCDSPAPALVSRDHANRLEFIPLTRAELPEMQTLAQLTKPGPFAPRTHELGDYLGIRSAGILAAMAGERLRFAGYTEISAVCTHPDYLGRGFAGALMVELMRRIRRRGELPFLHVRSENTRAIQLYECLGFKQRASFYYTVLRQQDGQTAPEP